MQSEQWYRERLPRAAALSGTDKSAIRDDWQELTGKEFNASFSPTCPNKYNDAIILILKSMKQAEKSDGYILRKGAAFRYNGTVYTRENLTTEAAEWFLKQEPNNRRYFTKIARDYESYEKGVSKTHIIEE